MTAILATPAIAAGDGYGRDMFSPDADRGAVMIEVVTHSNFASLRTEAAKLGALDPESLRAFNVYRPNDKTCIIHIVSPKVEYSPDILGHELSHCFWGSWHRETQAPRSRRRGR